MNDEDFVMGYCVGFNDGVGSGGSGGVSVIIKDGATVYDVPILHNYSIVGTDYGLATFDVNECAFLNVTPIETPIKSTGISKKTSKTRPSFFFPFFCMVVLCGM